MPATPNASPPANRRRVGSATFRSLRHHNYRLWFFGQGLSLIGTWMQNMAQQVLVYRLTDSAAALGAINFIGLIPTLVLAPLGGSIADRVPKRTILLITQGVMLCQALLLAGLTWTDTIQVWHVYTLAFFLSIAHAFDMPARQAIIVDMVEGKEDLTNAIALNATIFNAARAMGPALAGLAVAATGEGTAFFINSLSFVAVIISLLMMRNLPQRPPQRPTRLVGHMAEGIHYIGQQQTIKVLMSMVAVSAFLSMPYTTLMPVFANKVLGKSAEPTVAFLCQGDMPLLQCQTPQAVPLGLLLTMVGIGALVGSLLVASLPDTARRGRMLTIGNLSFPLALLLFSLSRSFLLSVALLILVGMAFVWQNSLANTLLQLVVPDELRGRVMGVYGLSLNTTMRLGGMQAGLVADRIGAPLSVGVGAAVSLVYGLFVALRYPKVRELR
ncbi:MAG: MFS transporter [Chloroflexi bacterium]|nr:MFS transporter [Chloroflexota bacterium]